jgi:hypothetical protein
MANNRNRNYRGGDVVNERSEAGSRGSSMVKSSQRVGQDVGAPMPQGILGAPLAKGNSTMTAKASDRTGPPSMTRDLNAANDRAQRKGTGR